jgi:hypothetical protein
MGSISTCSFPDLLNCLGLYGPSAHQISQGKGIQSKKAYKIKSSENKDQVRTKFHKAKVSNPKKLIKSNQVKIKSNSLQR